MAKTKRDWEKLLVRFPLGTEARFDALLEEGEDRTSVIRALVESELRRRERLLKRQTKGG